MATKQTLITIPVAGSGVLAPFVLLSTNAAGAVTGVTMTGSAFETGGSVIDQHGARILRHLGHQTWVVVQGDSIYRTTDAAATWTTVHGPDADLGTTVTKSAIRVVFINGIATLAFVGYDGAGGYTLFTSADGVTWSKSAKFALTAQTMALQTTTLWRGSLYCTAGLGLLARTYQADYWSKTIVEITQPDVHGTQNDSCFAVFNGQLYGAWTQLSNGRVGLYQLQGGAWVFVGNLGAAISTFAADRKIALFVQGASMYAIFMEDNPDFPVPDPVQWIWRCTEISSALAFTDRPTPVAVIHGGETNTSRVMPVVESPVGGGSIPEINLYFATAGAPLSGQGEWLWNGAFAALTAYVGGGLSVQDSWPGGSQYNGNVFWVSGQRAIDLVQALPTMVGGAGVRWGYRLYSPNPSVDTVSVQGFWGTAADEYPCAQLAANPSPVLTSPTAGTLIGQIITGLDAADNGATLFEVTWLAATNGGFPFALGEYSKTVLEVF